MPLPAALALSGLSEESLPEECRSLYQTGALLLRSPRLTSKISIHSTCSQTLVFATTRTENQKNRSPPSSPTLSIKKNFEFLLELEKIELALVIPGDTHAPLRQLKYKFTSTPKEASIIYQNRNILDLGRNIRKNWKFKAAEVRQGPLYFYKNQSQFTRVLNGEPLDLYPEVKICPDDNCLFEEYKYR